MALHPLSYKESNKSPTALGGSTPGATIASKIPFSIEDILFQNGSVNNQTNNNNNNNSSANYNVKSAKFPGSSPGSHVIDGGGGGSNSSSSSSNNSNASVDSCGGPRKVPQFESTEGNVNSSGNNNNSSKFSDSNVIRSDSNRNNGHGGGVNGISGGDEDYRKTLQSERFVIIVVQLDMLKAI